MNCFGRTDVDAGFTVHTHILINLSFFVLY